MATAVTHTVTPAWRVLLTDMGLNSANVLRRAELPDDLFGREKAELSSEEFFRLWHAIEDEADDPLLPLRLGLVTSIEAFDPPIFAALCSPDLNTALKRIAQYKKLCAPVVLHVEVNDASTSLEIEWIGAKSAPPLSLIFAELVFFVQIARIGTREEIRLLKVFSPSLPEERRAYADYFGVAVSQGERPAVVYSSLDATRPFLTSNEKLWSMFEPDLRRRLAELEEDASTTERVRAALLELLPSGSATIDAVARKLFASNRTLQRRLKEEGNSFQEVLSGTRSDLAKSYLRNSDLSPPEISFLLGFEDPNSFFRAFRNWTGATPEQARNAERASLS